MFSSFAHTLLIFLAINDKHLNVYCITNVSFSNKLVFNLLIFK